MTALRRLPALAVFLLVAAVAPAAAPRIGGFQPGHSKRIARGAIPYRADFLAGRPRIGAVRLTRSGARVQVTVAVRYPVLRRAWRSLLPDRATYRARIRLRLSPGQGRPLTTVFTRAVPLGEGRPGGGLVVHRILLSAKVSRRVEEGRARFPLQVLAGARFDQFGDGAAEEVDFGRARRTVRVHGSAVAAAQAGERRFPCAGDADLVARERSEPAAAHRVYVDDQAYLHFEDGPRRFRLCVWSGLPLAGLGWFDFEGGDFPGPTARGRLSQPRVEDGYVTILYTPDPGINGGPVDRLRFGVDGVGGSTADGVYDLFDIRIIFRPFEMRATGDSITAGWGYRGTGAAAQFNHDANDFDAVAMQLCSPDGDSYSNKCSSNSAAGPGDDDTAHRFSDDTGLSNNVSWAAQFANRHRIPRMSPGSGFTTYGNYAISGARPEHYVLGGRLADVMLRKVIDYNPDLTVMTLGANPLLANFLTDKRFGRTQCGARGAESAQVRYRRAIACMERELSVEDVRGRLRAVYRRLLDAPHNRVFVALYPLAYPALPYYAVTAPFVNQFDPWVLEALVTRLNEEIKHAVQEEAAYDRAHGRGNRLFLVTPPRFNLGTGGLAEHVDGAPGQRCPTPGTNLAGVDGVSRQSAATQSKQRHSLCYTTDPNDYWFESLDGGIHLSRAGALQYAKALQAAVSAAGVRLP